MITEANKDVVRRFYDLLWNKADIAQASQLIHPSCVRHDPAGPVPSGPEGSASTRQKWITGFSDLTSARAVMPANLPATKARVSGRAVLPL